MIGSAFILHKSGWCCSNSVTLDMYSDPVIGPDGKVASIRQMQSLMVESPFNTLPGTDEECDFIFKPDDIGATVAFKGRIKMLKPTMVLVVTSSIKDHKYIIDSIKNNIGI